MAPGSKRAYSGSDSAKVSAVTASVTLRMSWSWARGRARTIRAPTAGRKVTAVRIMPPSPRQEERQHRHRAQQHGERVVHDEPGLEPPQPAGPGHHRLPH